MERRLEKEVMDDKEQAIAYARADFSSSNKLLINEISRQDLSGPKNLLDLGCGPAAIPIRLAEKFPELNITAVDASEEMLNIAKELVQLCNLQNRVAIVHGSIPGLKSILNNQEFDFIISKDLLHHLPDPLVFWEEIKNLSNKGTQISVMDLVRPEKESDAAKIVQAVSGKEAKVLQEDFYNSLLAAFTIAEIEQQLASAGLAFEVSAFGERHFLVKGVAK
jgi:ubiquinone/menaquinone biosynthesis C-methylase UbiE